MAYLRNPIQTYKRTAAGVRFAVDDVIPATELLPVEPLQAAFAKRVTSPLIHMAEPDTLVVVPADSHEPNERPLNAFIETVHLAFSQHRPLVLSPDSIWFVIAQGFAHHINETPERFRGRMVAHQGRETLRVRQDRLDFGAAIAQFSSMIRERTDPALQETLLCDFSTTTPVIRTASEVVLMDAYQAYFEYHIYFICGIPAITLQGTVNDWDRIRARVEVLATYDLQPWVERLRPILDQFVRTAAGHVDRDFWKAIYKPQQAYGSERVTGWIADLFPYIGERPHHRNPVLETDRLDWTVPIEKGITPASFPSGFSEVPLKLEIYPNPAQTRELRAGFFGVGQSTSDSSLYPVISWCLLAPDEIGDSWELLAQRFATEPKRPETPVNQGDRALALNHFAGRYASMDLALKRAHWRIVPSFELHDREDRLWTCFAYDAGARENNRPGRVLALEPLKESPNVQRIWVCDLRPGCDPLDPPQLTGPDIKEWKKVRDTVSLKEFVVRQRAALLSCRLLEGDLFACLSRLIEREGEVD